jgi:hypothetical protein
MPQTTSAVALWVVQLDALIAPYLDKAMASMFLFTIAMSNVHSHLIPHS